MTITTTAYGQYWVGAIDPRLPASTYWVIVTAVTTTLAVVLALTALVWLLRSSRPHHAMAKQAWATSVVALLGAVAVTTLGTVFAVPLGEWWSVLIVAWTVAAVAAAAVLVVERRHRIRSDAKDSVAAGETRS